MALRIQPLFTVAALTVAWAGRAAVADVTNGGFEDGQGSGADGWTLESTAKPPPRMQFVDDHPHSGAGCARITIVAPGSPASLRQRYPLDQFGRYELTAWLRSAEPGLAVQVDLRELKGPQIPVAIKTFTVGTEWQRVAVRGIAPNTVDGAVSISCSSAGTLFVDDVSVAARPPETVDVPAVLPRPVDPLYFGMHFHEGPIHTAYPPELEPKYLRLWDDHVSWSVLEPKKGQWDFTRLDAIVAHAPPDVRIILMLGQTPDWASTGPEEKGAYGMGSAYMPRDIGDWRDYLQTVGTRYKGRIKYWEVWNECNWRTFWRDSITNMVRLTRATHDVLKAIDPTNVILSPGFTKDLGEGFINQWFYEGAGKDVDVISYHFYPTPSVDAAFVMAQDVMELKRSYGCADLPLFDTEYGEKRRFRQVPILGQMNLLYWFAGIEQQTYYTYDDKAFGLTLETSPGHFDPARLNAAGVAYAQTRQWMLGATAVAWSVLPDRIHTVEFTRPGGYRCHAVWKLPPKSAPQDPVLPHEGMVPEAAMVAEDAVRPTPFAVPADWHVTTMRDLAGHRQPVTGGVVQVTDSPILLETGALP
jgi:hypothetical protein